MPPRCRLASVRRLSLALLLFATASAGGAQNRLRVALEESAGWEVSGTYVHTTLLSGETWIARGTAAWVRSGEGFEVRVEGTVAGPGGSETRSTLRGGPAGWALFDTERSTWIRSADLTAPGPMQEAPGALLAMLALPIFDPDAGRGCAAVQQTIDFGGTDCRVVGCKRGAAAYVWYIGAEDGRPRFVERTTEMGGGERRTERLTFASIAPRGEEALPALEIPADAVRLEQRGASSSPSPPSLAQLTADAASLETESVAPTSLADSPAPLVEAFNAGRGRPRVVGLFAPS